MITSSPGAAAATPPSADPPPPPEAPLPPTPWSWRLAIAAGIGALGLTAYLLHTPLGYRFQAGMGILCFLGLAAFFSKSLQSVNLKTLFWGIALQFLLAISIIHSEWVQW